jgi:hypothetical protein
MQLLYNENTPVSRVFVVQLLHYVEKGGDIRAVLQGNRCGGQYYLADRAHGAYVAPAACLDHYSSEPGGEGPRGFEARESIWRCSMTAIFLRIAAVLMFLPGLLNMIDGSIAAYASGNGEVALTVGSAFLFGSFVLIGLAAVVSAVQDMARTGRGQKRGDPLIRNSNS